MQGVGGRENMKGCGAKTLVRMAARRVAWGMTLFLLTALTMLAFAANSILNRMAVWDAGMDPLAFAVIRVAAGAVVLAALVWRRVGRLPDYAPARRWKGAASLGLYMIGFSLAYLTLDAGIGALILFGGVQITMFAASVMARESVPPLRWLGAVVAMAGLVYLLWPRGAVSVDAGGALLMAGAALGWGIYSILGRGAADALEGTAANLGLLLPVMVLPALVAGWALSPVALALAVTSGAVTSGLGYALWYRVLPQMAGTTAAIAQLSVPVIAVAAGAVLLGEPVTRELIVAAALVLGGIGISTFAGRRG